MAGVSQASGTGWLLQDTQMKGMGGQKASLGNEKKNVKMAKKI